jgi:DNA-binding NarL/FixJ family response regulator
MIRVLLADDNPVIRQGVAGLLALEDDIEIIGQACTGAEAVTLARAGRPDVTLLDVRMPEMDGVTAAGVLQELTRVLMLTYSDDEQIVTAALRAGACGYLVHGEFTPEQLVDGVRTVAQGGTVIAGTAARVLVQTLRQAPPVQDASELLGLTKREEQIMRRVVQGRRNRAIAEELFLSEKTVKNHLNRIYAKLGAESRGEAIGIWLGVIPHMDPQGA